MIVIYNEERTCYEAARIVLGSLLEDVDSKSRETSKDASGDFDETGTTSEEWASLLFDMMMQYLNCGMERNDWVRFLRYSDIRIKDWVTEKEVARLAGARDAIEKLHRMLTMVVEEWGHRALTEFLKGEAREERSPDPRPNNGNLDSGDYTFDPEDYPTIEEEEKEVICHFDNLCEDLFMIEALLKNYKT
tara:strand:+ start:1927 stop:2496 length:570 start_codon:yes stop_codon:yes gene_type:complete